MTDDPDGKAAAELARQLVVHAPPNGSAHWTDWIDGAATAMAADPEFAKLVLTSLTITASGALWSLDQWSPGCRAAVLQLGDTQP